MRSQTTGSSTDDELAKFTDQVLSDDRQGELTESEDPELAKLEKTILTLQRARGPEMPSEQAQEKIKRGLAAEWRQMQRAEQVKASGSYWSQLGRKLSAFVSGARRPQVVFSLAVVTVVVLIGIVVLYPPTGVNLPAAADGGWLLPAALVVCGVLGGLLFWSLRKRP